MTTVTTFVENISSVEAVEEDIVYAVDGLAVVRDDILNLAEVTSQLLGHLLKFELVVVQVYLLIIPYAGSTVCRFSLSLVPGLSQSGLSRVNAIV